MIKNFLILGASSGIGKSFLINSLEENNNVVGVSRSIEDKFLKEKLQHNNLQAYNFDFKDLSSSSKFLNDLSKDHGAFDGIFICVGVESIKASKILSDNDIKNVFIPPIVTTSAVIKNSFKDSFLKPYSNIVVMSSVSAVKSTPAMMFYAASKAAIESMVRTGALELAQKKKNINCIRAGAFDSEMHQRVMNGLSDDKISAFEERFPLGFGETNDVLEAVKFYIDNEKSGWITGSSVNIDGGYLS